MRYGMQIKIGLLMMAVAKIGMLFNTNPIEAKVRRDEVDLFQAGDPAMEAAYRRGRATLEQFLAANDNRPPNSRAFEVKLGISDGGKVEWFWIKDVTHTGDAFRGTIDNAPRFVGNVQKGQAIEFARTDIVDWMYVQDGRVKGNFTACVLLAKEDPKSRDDFLRKIGMDCGV